MADTGLRLTTPAYPGSFLRTEIIEGRGLSITVAGEVLGVTRSALLAVLNGRAALSLEMALRFEKAFGLSMDTLMRMQNSHDIAQARKREGEIMVRPYAPDAGPAPRPGLV